MPLEWSRWPNFSEAELRCKHTGRCFMDPSFMDWLQYLRNTMQAHRELLGVGDVSLRITSGYRDPSHPIEAAKGGKSGAHSSGRAVDIACDSDLFRFLLVTEAADLGCRRIGVAKTFIHLDTWGAGPTPRMWFY